MLFNTLFQPPQLDASTPSEQVYLIQYSTWGHHSLGFYRNGQIVEFTYGDWDMFALDKRDVLTAITHMIWPTQGALGRKTLDWDTYSPLVKAFTDCQTIIPFPVCRALSETLYNRLNQAFEARSDQQVFHKADGVYFIPYDVSYALWNNCNHELAKWLLQLNGRVSGRIFWNPDFVKGMTPKLPSIE